MYFSPRKPMLQLRRREILVCCLVIGFIAALIVPAIFRVREAARRTHCVNNLKQIGLGMHNHHDIFNALPIGIETSASGAAVQNWRPRIYPAFMEQFPLFYDRSLPWDSPKNKRLINGTPVTMTDKGGGNPRQVTLDPCPEMWRCPTADSHDAKRVGYAVVVGESTPFPLNRAISFGEITDGVEHTIMVVETRSGSPYWTEPIELHFDSLPFAINGDNSAGISSFHPGGVNVCFADGSVHFLTDKISTNELRALVTIAGNESVSQ